MARASRIASNRRTAANVIAIASGDWGLPPGFATLRDVDTTTLTDLDGKPIWGLK